MSKLTDDEQIDLAFNGWNVVEPAATKLYVDGNQVNTNSPLTGSATITNIGGASGTISNIPGVITSDGTGSNNMINNPGYYDNSFPVYNSGINTEMELDMDDLNELLATAENRADILLAYGELIRDKLLSMPNCGGLEAPETIPSPVIALGWTLANAMAQGHGQVMQSLLYAKVYRDGTFKMKIRI